MSSLSLIFFSIHLLFRQVVDFMQRYLENNAKLQMQLHLSLDGRERERESGAVNEINEINK